ncbi:LLM class flavin-dependent oxidoreductase [Streptosporangium sp. NPDC002524]|uniref:LLM class flavin-dependent oxidoreductase n=1 Tax=Streptosporangium sp. NPDC002524 TaxID=3154537 RepID=UPI00331E6E8A
MRVGIFLVAAGFPGRPQGRVLRDCVEAIEVAEEAGFDDAWIAEHHFMSYGVCPSAATLAAVALGRTRTIGVGTAVSVLSTQHPVALAEQAAMLHHLSGGRFTLGVGRGGPWIDLEVFGTGLARFERGFAESLDLLCRALERRTVSAEGEFFRFREVAMVPAASMRPVVACTSPETTRLAAGRGLPMLLGMHLDDAGKAAMLADYDATPPPVTPPPVTPSPAMSSPAPETGAEAGAATTRHAPRHVAAVVGHVADSTRAAIRELKAAMPRWLEPGLAGYVPVDGRRRPVRDVGEYVDFLTGVHPVGDAGRCVETIRRTREVTGLEHLILMVEGAGEHARTLENIRRLGAEVLPGLGG